jgi:uncharacterized membrane protein YgcG
MRKTFIILLLVVSYWLFGLSSTTPVISLQGKRAVVQAASVGAINDEIQPDQVNLNTIGYTDTTSEANSVSPRIGEKINSYISLINIQKDGKIQVKETIDYDFADLQKHGIYRTIPTIKTNQDGKKYRLDFSNFIITDEKGSSMDYTRSDANDKISFKIGNPNKTITGLHTYVISYTVSGALTYFSDHDELYWNVTGTDWTVPIAHITPGVFWSSGVSQDKITTICYTGSKGNTAQDCVSSKKDNEADFVTNKPLDAGEGLTIVVGFPKNIVAVVEPQLVVPFAETLLGKLFYFALGLLATWWFVLYPLIIIFKWWKYGRDPKATVGVTTAWFDPPKTPKGNRFMTPGEVGTLGDETVDMKDITATIVDLARRGYIKIEERKKGDFYFIKTKDFTAGLLPFESKLLTGMLGGKKEIRLKDEKLYETVNDVTQELYNDVVATGLFPKNPNSIRTFYTAISAIALFTGNLFLAFVAFAFGRNMPVKTLWGVNAFNVAKSLKNFLTSQERQLKFQAEKQMMFEKLLPYAVAFGVEKIWAKRFETMNLQQPDWYQGYGSNQFNSVIFANNLNSSMSSFRSASSPPTTTRSSSGFSSGFSGGFSGGGGGGGGGGSW